MDPSSTSRAKARERVVLQLPDDFLRVSSPVSPSQTSPTHVTAHSMPGVGAQHLAAVRPAATTQGKLSVTIAQAKLGKNYGYVRMDPYARVRIGHYVFETETDSNGAVNPRWDKTFTCYIPPGMATVHVEIFDERTFGTDERVAWAQITIPQRVFEGEIVDDWYQLSGKQGEHKEGMIEIVLSYQLVQVIRTDAPHAQVLVANYPYGPAVLPGAVYGIPAAGASPVVTPTVVPQVIQITEEDVKQLKEMFPNVEDDVIQSVLEAQNGNKSAAINALLSITEG